MMLDPGAGYAQDLRACTKYTLHPRGRLTSLTLAVGVPDRVSQLIARIVPTRYSLIQNYPNPVNPATTIPLEIPMVSHVRLEVYDLLGRHVSTLFEGDLPAARHYFQWFGTGERGIPCASGVYFARLTVRGGPTLVRRMSLVR